MDGNRFSDTPGLTADRLGQLMPMFVWIAPGGLIRACGPTLAKLCQGQGALAGTRFFDRFTILRPEAAATMEELSALAGQPLRMTLAGPDPLPLRGLAVPLDGSQGLVLNLAFGMAAADAVARNGLTRSDFAVTDKTVDLLFLAEAKAAVLAELNALNRRLQAAQEAAEERALTDALTGLANRRAFDAELAAAIAGLRRGGADFALVHLDLDFFKAVNDGLGHAAGDAVLGRVGMILRGAVRGGDAVARVGGDEFVAILRTVRDRAGVTAWAARTIALLEVPIPFEGQDGRISGSIGAVLSGDLPGACAADLMAAADTALYASKRAGRRRATLFDGTAAAEVAGARG